MPTYSYLILQVTGSFTFVLYDGREVNPDYPIAVSFSDIEDNIPLRQSIAAGVRDGKIIATYNGNQLTHDDVMHIDDIRSGGGGGDSSILAKGSPVVTNVLETTITFANPASSPYLVVVTPEDNVNVWIERISPTSFKIMFSASYTGKINYLVMSL